MIVLLFIIQTIDELIGFGGGKRDFLQELMERSIGFVYHFVAFFGELKESFFVFVQLQIVKVSLEREEIMIEFIEVGIGFSFEDLELGFEFGEGKLEGVVEHYV